MILLWALSLVLLVADAFSSGPGPSGRDTDLTQRLAREQIEGLAVRGVAALTLLAPAATAVATNAPPSPTTTIGVYEVADRAWWDERREGADNPCVACYLFYLACRDDLTFVACVPAASARGADTSDRAS